MPTKKTKKEEAPPVPRVASNVSFPSRDPQRAVNAVRRPDSGGPRARTMPGFVAAEACNLFGRPGKGGGEAFSRWLSTNHPDVASDSRMSAAEWEPLLTEFASRPIHGHRRTGAGGNHRINKHHRR